jgi:hypothetical protein
MKMTKRNLLITGILVTIFSVQKAYTQDDAINTGTMYISTGTIVSDEGSFTTSASGSTENNGDFYLKGDWINNGSYPSGTGKAIFWGTNAQNISGTVSTVFYDAEVNKASNMVTLNINTEVSHILTLTNGPVDLNTKTMTISNSATAGITYTDGSLISEDTDNSSKVQWNIGSTTGAHVIPFIKSDGSEIPLTLDLTAGTIGNVTSSTYPSAPDNTPYPVTPTAVTTMNGPDGTDNSDNTVDRFWQIDKNGASGTVTITFTYAEGEEPANGETGLVAQRYSSGWMVPVPFQSNNTVLNTVTSPNVTLFGPYTLSQSANPLPLQMLTFEAQLTKQKQVDLRWETASEINHDFFTIERSKDLNNIEAIGTVKGAGNSTVINEYYTIDENPYSGISYYRIKQTDFSGKFSFTRWNTINNSNEDEFNVTRAYTNSATNDFTVEFTVPEKGEVKLRLFNSIGKVVYSKMIIANKGLNVYTFTKNNGASSGIYSLNAIYQNEMKSIKLISHNLYQENNK